MSKKNKTAKPSFESFLSERGISATDEKRVKKAKKIFAEIVERTAKAKDHTVALAELNKKSDKIVRETASVKLKIEKQNSKIVSLTSQKI